jgi:hypothetical protein
VRRALFLVAVVSACVPAGSIEAASSSFIVARSNVTALAADVDGIAYATSHTSTDSCDHIYVWQKSTRRIVQLGRRQHCPGDHGVAGISYSSGKALWVTWSGTKVRDWQLWTATAAKPTPRVLSSLTRTPDQPQPFVIGSGARGLLPYAVDTTVTVLRSGGSSPAFTWTAAAPVVALAAADGRVAVAEQGGRVTVLDSRGKTVSVDLYASDVSAVTFATKGLLVQRGTVLELRRQAEAHEYTISADSALADGEGNRAVWLDGKLVHVMKLPEGMQTATFAASFATLVGNRLYTANGRTIAVRTIR